MELLTLPQLAEAASIPLSAARYYRDRFMLFVPSVRIGRTVLHPREAIDVLALVSRLATGGSNVTEIESALERTFPVTVVTSQSVSGDISDSGPVTVIGELATMLDERGARVEREVSAIRDQLTGSATSTQLEGVVFETRLAAHVIGERFGSEMEQMKSQVEELRTQVGQLASRDQLEWIGDVVSAAITRSPGAGPSGTVEMKLLEIQEELHRPRPSDDVAELRIAVDRLAEHVSNRDKEFQRTLHALVNVMRGEVRTLQSEIKSLNGDRPTESMVSLPLEPVKVVAVSPPPVEKPVTPDFTEDSSVDASKSRAPRRLGHVSRPHESVAFDVKPAVNSEETA
ncbi:MAG: hypothetical protein ABL994_20480 [Verrucomicrobiales bacterium]